MGFLGMLGRGSPAHEPERGFLPHWSFLFSSCPLLPPGECRGAGCALQPTDQESFSGVFEYGERIAENNRRILVRVV